MVEWGNIQDVLLDMDGTLLDLYYDTHFWRELVPQRYAERHGLGVDAAKAELFPRMQALEGTMNWYCVDFWSRELDLDIARLKREIDHLIAVHPYVTDFLHLVRRLGRRIVLVTNAHHKSLELKMRRTGLAGHFDALVCAHDLGLPKESDEFWVRLQAVQPFDAGRALLVDDNLEALRAAGRFGVAHLVAVYRPDTRAIVRNVGEFPAIHSFRELMPKID